MLLNLLTFLFMLPVRADYLDFTFLDNPEIKIVSNSGPQALLKTVCDEMKYNYLEELKKFHEKKAQLDVAVGQPLTDTQLVLIKELKTEISQATKRLVFLSKPEWNSPVLKYVVRWWLPEDYLTTDRNVVRFTVTDLYYKGEFAGPLSRQIFKRFETYYVRGAYFPQKRTRQILEYAATGTYLELCQFVATLEVEVQVEYVFVDWVLPSPGTHMFFLKGRAP
jgi:hypothetical protein